MITAANPIDLFLSRLEGVRKSGAGWMARCPAHEDRHASLSVGIGDNGSVLVNCQAKCETKTILAKLGLAFADLYPRREGGANGHHNGNGKRAYGKVITAYDYADEHGELVCQSVRTDPKGFFQRRPDGNGAWINNLQGVRRVLYRLPELLNAREDRPDEWRFVVEGEKDVDRLMSLGLIATTNIGGAGKWTDEYSEVLRGSRIGIIVDNDDPGRKHGRQVAESLSGKAAQVRLIELPGLPPKGDVSDWLDAGGTGEKLIAIVEKMTGGTLPHIEISTDEHRVIAETISALGSDPNLFNRGGILVRVLRETQPDDGVLREGGSPTISPAPAANLRERMTRSACFYKLNFKGDKVPAHPAPWLVSGIEARGEWPGIRSLVGISDAPILRADGSIWQQRGYDEHTGVLFESANGASFPAIDAEVTIDDADASAQRILEPVCDFSFEAEEHKSAYLSALLTPVGRFAFEGPSPLFLIDSNIRGAGKGLLAQSIGTVVLGRPIPVSSYAHDTDEMRKKITSIAIAGDRMILLDNIAGAFGNDALDRALTTTRWTDRILGKSENVNLPLIPTWYGTGNNVQVAADTARRIIHIRLDVMDEKPEERTGFRHPNLIGWIAEHRAALLVDALTILSAYCRAGRPSQNLTPFGSFEGWSDLIRSSIVWLGMPDPCLTRKGLAAASDSTTDALTEFITTARTYDVHGHGIIVSELLARLYPPDRRYAPTGEVETQMRGAVEALVGCPTGTTPTARQLGNRLRHFRRRVVDGFYLDMDTKTSKGVRWLLKSG